MASSKTLFLAGLASLFASGLLHSQEPLETLQSIVRFQGPVSFHAPNGTARQLSVTIRNWSIASGRPIERFQEPGLIMVQVLAGQVTTMIDGKSEDRKTGDIWAVPTGSAMAISVKRETAVLQTVAAQ
jgi:quercetin dioxygenase-like cupin family protein